MLAARTVRLLAAGIDIIDNTNGLGQHFLPLVMSH
jgi:hypothetical protein